MVVKIKSEGVSASILILSHIHLSIDVSLDYCKFSNTVIQEDFGLW